MSEVKFLKDGLIELSTDKHISDLQQDEDVIAVYQDFEAEGTEQFKVLVDVTDIVSDTKRYIH